MIYVWYTEYDPFNPRLMEWAADCEHLTTANVDGSSMTFHMVRNFTWRTTRDRDEDWIEEVHVDAEDLKDVGSSLTISTPLRAWLTPTSPLNLVAERASLSV